MLHESKYIYCINVFNVWSGGQVRDGRCWGWFRRFEDAESCVKDNEHDIYEGGTYNMALIEKVAEGVTCLAVEEHWYSVKFDGKGYKVTVSNKPEDFKHIHFFSFQ
jgi:hypothetical protein